MSASKLFTPRLRAAQGTPIRRNEGAPIFVNPPTHAEIPVFVGPAEGGDACYPLSLGDDSGQSTTGVSRRPISSKNSTGNY